MRRLRNKLLFSFAVLAGVYTILFFLIECTSIDALSSLLGQNSNTETARAIAKRLRLDLPVFERYILRLNELSPISIHSSAHDSPLFFDKEDYRGVRLFSFSSSFALYLKFPYLGRSYQFQEPVAEILWNRFKITILLALSAILIASIIGTILGIVSAMYHQRWVDHLILLLTSIGISAPSFFVAILLAITLGYYLSDYTGLNFQGSFIEYNDIGEKQLNIKNLILPLIALSWRPLALITQLMRNNMIEVWREDYIRTAFAKGLSTQIILWRHAMRNALNPVITSISSWLGSLLGGAYFIEIIFDIKGLGSMTVNALLKMDIPLIMGASLYIACTFLVISLIVDFIYRWLDPRLQ